MNEIGMVWNMRDYLWNEMFEAAKAFAVKGQSLKIPYHYRTANERYLSGWYAEQRKNYAKGKISTERIEKLLSIGAELKPDIMKKSDVHIHEEYIRKNA